MTVFLFRNTRDVIKAEAHLLVENISCRIIPVPRSISSECGMGIEALPGTEPAVEKCLNGINIHFSKCSSYRK